MSDVTRILSVIEQGDSQAAEQLLPLVYQELRHLAAQKMAQETPDHSLQATALVHEAYVRLVDVDKDQGWDSSGHFFAAAAEAMRRILVDNARRKNSHKHGGDRTRVDLDEACLLINTPAGQLLELDQALTELQHHDPQAAKLVKLRYYAGLTHQDAANAMEIGRRAADRLWALARAWLYSQLTEK